MGLLALGAAIGSAAGDRRGAAAHRSATAWPRRSLFCRRRATSCTATGSTPDRRVRGLAARAPVLAGCFGLGLLALLGLPAVQPVRQRTRPSPAPASPPASAGRWPPRSSSCWSSFAAIAATAAAHAARRHPPRRRRGPRQPPARWPRPAPLRRVGLLAVRRTRASPLGPLDRAAAQRPPRPSDRHEHPLTPPIDRRMPPDRRRHRAAATSAGQCRRSYSPTATGSPWSPPTTTADRADARRRTCSPPASPDRRVELHPAPRPATTRASPAWPRCRSPPAGSNARCATCSASMPDGPPAAAPAGPPPALARRLVPDAPRRRTATRRSATADEPYPFLTVEATGVYEIPVGPVHAGLIEPGHFRFSVVGETILKLKARLWFVHKGIEKLFEGRAPDARRRAGRTDHRRHRRRARPGVLPGRRGRPATRRSPTQAQPLRARPAGARTALQPRHRHRRPVQRRRPRHPQRPRPAHPRTAAAPQQTTSPATGCSAARSPPAARTSCALPGPRPAARASPPTSPRSSHSPSANSVVRDRFTGTAVLTAEQARDIGTLGYVARASGLAIDARRDHPTPTSTRLPRTIAQPTGDVLARFCVRAEEVAAILADPSPHSTPRLAATTPTERRRPSPPAVRHGPPGSASSKAGAAPSCTASNSAPTAPDPGQDRRPVVLQLAGPAGRAGRHDRPRLPADQQELQPLLRRQRPLTQETSPCPATPSLPTCPACNWAALLRAKRLIRRHRPRGLDHPGRAREQPGPPGLRNRDAHTAVPQRWRHHRVQRHRAGEIPQSAVNAAPPR